MIVTGAVTIARVDVDLDDHWEVVRVVPDYRENVQLDVGEHSRSFVLARWVSTASVEGTNEQMRALARAIRRRGSFEARRCAVRFTREPGEVPVFYIWSPRNSFNMGWAGADGLEQGVLSLEQADALATDIEELLGGVPCAT